MSVDREKLENLLERIDEILLVLKGISDDLRTVSASLKSIAVGQIAPPGQQMQAPSGREGFERQKSVEDVRMSFPPDLESLLNIEERNDYIIIKPRQFLGSENFAKIASTVRGMGGEYISAGKDSHFRVPKRK
ncbi:MAG TPA: hypothetical protein VK209_04845 [Candidatus Sulfotelmatobacter sp.]|nr:hypothetical protein [Candidatus Sulfotelmatobacter sp.]